MVTVKYAIQDLRHGIQGVEGAMNLKERQDATTGPLLSDKKLNVEMPCVTVGTAMGGHGNGAFIVFSCGCGTREG
jgi:hypothetical protein